MQNKYMNGWLASMNTFPYIFILSLATPFCTHVCDVRFVVANVHHLQRHLLTCLVLENNTNVTQQAKSIV